MSQSMLARWLATLPALLALAVSAQAPSTTSGAATASARMPSDPSQGNPNPVVYRSALENYQPYSDNTLVSWKEANDTVGKLGGWRAYAKEASEPPPAQALGAGGAANPYPDHGKP